MFIAACSVTPNCLLYLLVVSIVVLSHPILCPVVRECRERAYCMWEKSVGLCKSSIEWASFTFL